MDSVKSCKRGFGRGCGDSSLHVCHRNAWSNFATKATVYKFRKLNVKSLLAKSCCRKSAGSKYNCKQCFRKPQMPPPELDYSRRCRALQQLTWNIVQIKALTLAIGYEVSRPMLDKGLSKCRPQVRGAVTRATTPGDPNKQQTTKHPLGARHTPVRNVCSSSPPPSPEKPLVRASEPDRVKITCVRMRHM